MNIIQSIVNGILGLLPDSPFTATIKGLATSPLWGYLNYFVPVSTILDITHAWAVAMGAYYAWGFVRKWVEKLAN